MAPGPEFRLPEPIEWFHAGRRKWLYRVCATLPIMPNRAGAPPPARAYVKNNQGNTMNGADSLCDTLLANDVDVCFANPGTSEMHFVAALDRKPKMRCVLGLFEGVVTGAADGYARMAAKPAATLLHLGPGLGNGLANLHNAKRARTPMVNIVGDHATYHVQYDAPLTSDVEGVARPMSHWVKRGMSAESMSADAAEAITVARRHPGNIATLILPADTAWTELPDNAPAPIVAKDEALALYKQEKPRMVLADIQLADGSSGIDAVNEILQSDTIPVIFITAFPERLLTGERPEPTFLVTKPFNPDMVKALISQALFFEEASQVAA